MILRTMWRFFIDRHHIEVMSSAFAFGDQTVGDQGTCGVMFEPGFREQKHWRGTCGEMNTIDKERLLTVKQTHYNMPIARLVI